jgi:crotonobetainyl-CoA:carnitine CoA-transferase CaiB-like acyl-CoA transferase
MDEVFADPQVQHLEMAAKVHHPVIGDIELVAQPFALTRTPSEIRTATPETGEHTMKSCMNSVMEMPTSPICAGEW